MEYLMNMSGRPPYKLTQQITKHYWENAGDFAEIAAQPASGFKLLVVTIEMNSNTVGSDGAISIGQFISTSATTPEETIFDSITFQEELRPLFMDFSECPIVLPAGKIWRVKIGAAAPVGRITITGWEVAT